MCVRLNVGAFCVVCQLVELLLSHFAAAVIIHGTQIHGMLLLQVEIRCQLHEYYCSVCEVAFFVQCLTMSDVRDTHALLDQNRQFSMCVQNYSEHDCSVII